MTFMDTTLTSSIECKYRLQEAKSVSKWFRAVVARCIFSAGHIVKDAACIGDRGLLCTHVWEMLDYTSVSCP